MILPCSFRLRVLSVVVARFWFLCLPKISLFLFRKSWGSWAGIWEDDLVRIEEHLSVTNHPLIIEHHLLLLVSLLLAHALTHLR